MTATLPTECALLLESARATITAFGLETTVTLQSVTQTASTMVLACSPESAIAWMGGLGRLAKLVSDH